MRTPEQKLARKLLGQTAEQKIAACLRARDWYQKNKERAKLVGAIYKVNHADEIRERKKQEYYVNKAAILEHQKTYYQKNKVRIKSRVSVYQKANPIAANARAAKYVAKYPERHREHCRVWEKSNPDAVIRKNHDRRARKNNIGGRLSKDIIKSLLAQQNSKCIYCKTDISEIRHLDHRMPLKLGGMHVDSNMQLTCPRCNQQKGAKHPDVFAAQTKK